MKITTGISAYNNPETGQLASSYPTSVELNMDKKHNGPSVNPILDSFVSKYDEATKRALRERDDYAESLRAEIYELEQRLDTAIELLSRARRCVFDMATPNLGPRIDSFLRTEPGDRKNAEFVNIDFLGQALELEACAKRSESQTAERAMSAAAHTLRKVQAFVTPN